MEFFNEDYLDFSPKKKHSLFSKFKKNLKDKMSPSFKFKKNLKDSKSSKLKKKNLSADFSNFKNSNSNPQKNPNFKKQILIPFIFSSLILCILYLSFHISAINLTNPRETKSLTLEQKTELNSLLNKKFLNRTQILHNLPYKTVNANLFINAKSAILIDVLTGDILFEKNADQEIPPASMTKLVEMYVVFDAVEKGEVSLDDTVPLPKESWAVNLPSDASIMFLAQDQIVTLRELLLGLSIASGNDASVAVAHYVAGDMESFVQKMNDVIKNMGLTKTHFVESSGYSEKNITTAKEFAAFCRNYITRFPFAIKEFHSQKVLRYPLEKNLPEYKKSKGDSEAVIQYNTNKLLGKLEGVDGLKTGFIYESGYNLALTATRDNRRFLSVTMGGPGIGSAQGNLYRNADGKTLMDFAFNDFASYVSFEEKEFAVNLSASKEKSVKLIPAFSEDFTVPFIKGNSVQDSVDSLQIKVKIPQVLIGKVSKGEQYGTLTFSLEGNILNEVPLVADRDSSSKSKFQIFLAQKLYAYNRCFTK